MKTSQAFALAIFAGTLAITRQLHAAPLSDLPTGVWTNVTPPDFEIGSFGTQSCAVDPVNPGYFYFMGNGGQGIWKSTDFGVTWNHIMPKGFIYMMTIDPNPKRDPKTPPTLWTCAGYGVGVARSTDDGKTWKTYKVDNTVVVALGDKARANDTYNIEVDPADSNHLLVSIHGTPGISESHDGGATWSTITAVDGSMGSSLYPFFTDPSPAEAKAGATRSTTWLTISQQGSGGVFRTVDGGKTFTKVEKLLHGHGNAQMATIGNGVVYMCGYYGSQGNGVYRSADYGITWTRVNDGTAQDDVYATGKFIYADDGWATGGVQTQKLQRAPLATGTLGTWTNYYPNPPMTNGSGHAVVSSDGTHSVILTSNWKSGVWRYIEP